MRPATSRTARDEADDAIDDVPADFPDGHRAYVVDPDSESVSAVDTG